MKNMLRVLMEKYIQHARMDRQCKWRNRNPKSKKMLEIKITETELKNALDYSLVN